MVHDSKKNMTKKKDIPPLLTLSCLQEKMQVSKKNKKNKKRKKDKKRKKWKWT